MYYPAHLPGDTLSNKARQSLITTNWDLIPVTQTPLIKKSSTVTTQTVTTDVPSAESNNSNNSSEGIANAAYSSGDGRKPLFKLY